MSKKLKIISASLFALIAISTAGLVLTYQLNSPRTENIQYEDEGISEVVDTVSPTIAQFESVKSASTRQNVATPTPYVNKGISCEINGKIYTAPNQSECDITKNKVKEDEAYLVELKGLNQDITNMGNTWKAQDQLLDCRLYNPVTKEWYTVKLTMAGCASTIQANIDATNFHDSATTPVSLAPMPEPSYSTFKVCRQDDRSGCSSEQNKELDDRANKELLGGPLNN